MLGIAEEPTPDPDHRYLITPLASGDGWGFEMDLVSTGSAFSWLSGLFGWKRDDELVEAASRAVPGAGGLTFLPYVGFGEQGALRDPVLRGTLHGLTTQHSRDDVARALVEGILLEFRRCAAVLGPSGEIVISGGPSESPFFRQALASAVGATCAASPLGPYASAYGAAMLARSATGALDADVTARPEVLRTEPGDGEAWNELAERHDALLAAVRT